MARSLLHEPLRRVLGGGTATQLEKRLDLHTVEDLLRHYPRRYESRGELTDLVGLQAGEHVTVLAEIAKVTTRDMKTRRGSLVEVIIKDQRGQLSLTFFNQRWRARELQVGRRGLFSGKVGTFKEQRQLAHPDYLLLPDTADVDAATQDFAGELIPVYPATEKLSSWAIAKAVRVILDTLDGLVDPLPARVRLRHGLIGLRDAFWQIHRPTDYADVERARKRLRFDEAFVLQVQLARRRRAAAALPAVPRNPRADGLLAQFDRRLPYSLTEGQRRVGAEIAADLARDHPMHRLLQGEVGSGKTVVALRAMLSVVDAGGQAALLAPTEVLAQQHYRSVRALLGPLAERGLLGGAQDGTRVALVTGSQRAAGRRRALLEAASGEAGLVIGTHALLEEQVQFADLGLVVIDEQHRFGVEQRAALAAKAAADARPHVLVMTATPIPRTVAMTVFGDLEVSTLRELPAGRADVETHVVPVADKPHFLERAWERVREEVGKGRQVYIVCPRIGGDVADEPSDYLEGGESDRFDREDSDGPGRRSIAVLDLVDQLRGGPLAGLSLEVLHGRLPPEVKDEVMARFVGDPTAGPRIDVLVGTTVIEVGIDVPNASMMVIMDADRFGVSQLHQLRGRVGRGGVPGLCLLVTEAEPASPARQRIDAVAATRDGFELSVLDLQQRREGDVLGVSQSGRRSSLRLLSVIKHEEIIRAAREDAVRIVAADPHLWDHPALRAEVEALVGADRADFLDKT